MKNSIAAKRPAFANRNENSSNPGSLTGLPSPNREWARRCDAIHKKLGVSPADIFYAVRVRDCSEFFSQKDWTDLCKKHGRSFDYFEQPEKALSGGARHV